MPYELDYERMKFYVNESNSRDINFVQSMLQTKLIRYNNRELLDLILVFLDSVFTLSGFNTKVGFTVKTILKSFLNWF